jgi:2-beta-glucuronyltransferase
LKNVLIVTGQHFATSPRKVDLHFIADVLTQEGAHVDFLSLRLSWISRLSQDGRFNFARQRRMNRWTAVSAGVDEYIWYSPFHLMNLRNPVLNRVSGGLFRLLGSHLPAAVRKRLSDYTDILIESGQGPLMTAEIRALAPGARIIYHAADRLSTIGSHPAIQKVLERTIGDYDLVHIMAEALRSDIPSGPPVVYLPHGISKQAFDTAQNPYARGRNVVSVGDMLFDAHAVAVLAASFPDWTFHLFGKKAMLEKPPANVITHGEVPFEQVVGYIKFADIGLAPYLESGDADYLSQSSLKMIQYTYCRLPIIAPSFAAAGRDHVHAYMPADDDSLRAAFERAKAYDRDSIDAGAALSWQEKTDALFSTGAGRRDVTGI